jgi:hypothetical protein
MRSLWIVASVHACASSSKAYPFPSLSRWAGPTGLICIFPIGFVLTLPSAWESCALSTAGVCIELLTG